jgi:uncharacterized protein YecT (DUF1311 family)
MMARRLPLYLVPIAFLLASAAFAGDGPKIDCNNATTQTDMNICSHQDFETADKSLNAIYKKALAFAASQDLDLANQPDLQGAAKALKKAQRAWVDYRDGQCESYGFGARGGSMEPMLVAGCQAELTRKRTHELKELLAYPEDVPEDGDQN